MTRAARRAIPGSDRVTGTYVPTILFQWTTFDDMSAISGVGDDCISSNV